MLKLVQKTANHVHLRIKTIFVKNVKSDMDLILEQMIAYNAQNNVINANYLI